MTMVVHRSDGSESFKVQLQHTFNEAQIQWFHDGSALNTMAKSTKKN
jgi:aconitate hydratase